MPGKHVHFSEYATTPSPVFSSSTLPSTPGPITPPPLGFGSPYHTTPLPSEKNAVANPALAVSKNPVIQYDLTQPPTLAAITRTHIPVDLWAQPATKPLFPSIDVICPLLPWKITIHSRSKPYVTVGDLLEELYRALRTPATAAEYALLPTTDAKQKVSAAFHFRCKQISDPVQQKMENAKGLKRVDFLGKHTQFRGIVWNGLDGWTLMVS